MEESVDMFRVTEEKRRGRAHQSREPSQVKSSQVNAPDEGCSVRAARTDL